MAIQSIFEMLPLIIVISVIIGIICIINNISKKREIKNLQEQKSRKNPLSHTNIKSQVPDTMTLKVTSECTLSVIETNYAPDSVNLPDNATCYESTSGNIGFLNYRKYAFSAKYIETNRMRKRYKDGIFNDNDLKKEITSLLSQGYCEPITYEPVPPETATESQLDYINSLSKETGCKINIPLNKLSKADASGIITYMTDGGHTPSKEIIEYASELEIQLSYCFPDWLIYKRIYETLSTLKDKIFFFIFCVHRDEYDAIYENPNQSPSKELYLSFAEKYSTDPRFIESFQKYHNTTNGHNLVRFGETITADYPKMGGNRRTLAYKTAIQFLKNNL